jgi:long-chain acyl-CoA synthetase
MNVADILDYVRDSFIDRPVILFEYTEVSLQLLEDQIFAWRAKFAAQGISRGDTVVLLARNSPQWMASCFAALAEGLVVVPVNPALTANEVGHIVDHCEPRLLVADSDLIALCGGGAHTPQLAILEVLPQTPRTDRSPPISCQAADPAFIFYTSGTTGKPKGAVISHGSVLHTTALEAKHFTFTSDDTTLVVGSLAFIYPLVLNALSCLRGGAAIALTDKFHPGHAIQMINQRTVTVLMGVPTMYVMLANYAQDNSASMPSLRLCISGGAVLPPSLVERFVGIFGVQLFDLWGLSEATPLTSYKPGFDVRVRPGSCGRPLPGVQLKVVNEDGAELPVGKVGEVWASSRSVMLGYFRNPVATAETITARWLRTGDLGMMDPDGYLYILGRKKDVVIRAGANVYPSEVEEVIFKMRDVGECCVVGVPHDVYGEELAAFIVSRGGSQLSADSVRQHCRKLISEYKIPTTITFVESLPKGPTGKILKRVLRDQWIRAGEAA